MPSFSFSKWKKRVNEQERRDIASNDKDGNNGKLQRRGTKRELIKNLFKGASTRSESNRRSGQFVAATTSQLPPPASPDKLTTPMADPNNPLPPPPAPDSQPEPAARPVKKFERIISPIALPDLHKLFSGAPQFFLRSQGHHTGAPHPSIAFPWDTEVSIRDICDHQQIQDRAWSSASAWPHISRDAEDNLGAVKGHEERQRAHYTPLCRERPNMLSMQGLERGTMGYQAALEMGVADFLQQENALDADAAAVAQRRMNFLRSKDGVRPLTESALVELLTRSCTAYHGDPANHQRPTIELYTELFTRILFPPSRVIDPNDPYSLPVQIEALIDVLGTGNIWFDFSLVEWRIRLGQILWGPPPEDEILINNEVASNLGDQKYWILLQILLSCELLMRLDAVSASIDHRVEPKMTEVHRFDKKSTQSVRWSLILARHWLENIKIEKLSPDFAPEKTVPTGWLASFKSAPSAKENEPEDTFDNVQFYGRHQTRQLSGLLHFARNLSWPNIESIAGKILSSEIGITEHTPAASTPLSVSTKRSSSYFTTKPRVGRGWPKQRMSAMIHPQGWLSNLYLSGMILPGEGISHLLISTLLENDESAISKLGDEAILYGGFSYEGRSFWSTFCIVGRVLAAGNGASECMGWVSSDITPKGSGESWVNIEVEVPSQAESDQGVKPRIWQNAIVEREGNVIGGADPSSVLPSDFIIPSEESTQKSFSIKLESLDLFNLSDSIEITPTNDTPTPLSDVTKSPEIRNCSAIMRFSVDVNGEGEDKKELNLALLNDVYFVTASPCVPSSHMYILKTPSSPTFQALEQHRSSGTIIGHPLHKAFTYTELTLSTILTLSSDLPLTSILSPSGTLIGDSTTHTTNSPIPRVLVIDCAGSSTTASPMHPTPSLHSSPGTKGRVHGSDAEILARALCAERGWNALISRKGRCCLSCSVREAGALGWRVILRFA